MNSTEKVIFLLKKLGTSPFEFSLTELSKEIECGKSGTYKILATLSKNGFVCQNTNKKYSLGSVISYLGKNYDENILSWDFCKPYMERLNEITGETVSLGIRENGDPRVVHRVISENLIRIDGGIGIKLPIHSTSIGKLLGAYDDFELIKIKVENEGLPKNTPNTIDNLQDLKMEYEKIRSQGFVRSFEENNMGVASVGAPLRDFEGKVWGCICIGSPKVRINDEILETHTNLVVSTAEEISKKGIYYNHY